MDGLIEQLKKTARGIEQRRQDLKEAGYHLGQAIRILEEGDDLVRVQIQEKKLESGFGEAALTERLEDPEAQVKRSGRGLVTEKPEPSETEDLLPKVEKILPMPPVKPPAKEPAAKPEPSETRPVSLQMGTGPKRYRDVSTRTAILDVLDKCLEPADAKQIHLRLVEGGWTCTGKDPVASVRAALSAMRFDDISQKKVQVGAREITHYYLPTMEEMNNR